MRTHDILIADDDWDLADLLAMRTKALGFNVRTAHDGLATLHAIQEQVPDLLILDVNMPTGNGLTVCETMATAPELSGIPVIILTGQKDLKTIRRCHDMGAHYLLKCPDVWKRLEPLLQKITGAAPPTRAPDSTVSCCDQHGE